MAENERDELFARTRDAVLRALADDVAAGHCTAELADQMANDTAETGVCGWLDDEPEAGQDHHQAGSSTRENLDRARRAVQALPASPAERHDETRWREHDHHTSDGDGLD